MQIMEQSTGGGGASSLIPEDLLRAYDARVVSLDRGEALFEQGETSTHFYLVRSGRIKMASYNDEGREFVQGYFSEGQSFGEPPFFDQVPYPASAIAVVESTVWKCPYAPFMRLLRENFDIHLGLTRVLSGRLVYKAMMLTEIAVEEAEHRIRRLIEYFRGIDARADEGGAYRVPFTRQQLADMTGLRVETVIRSIKSMEGKGLLTIEEGRVLWTAPPMDGSDNAW
jgi:CRP-like cAMP-binding protein